ncbi:dethiobiotin synthase [Luedemannella helvata]|uniref:ATP-dependent dethiobiotin synthetase BioD n=1 Tax=Luedemannella helvata TaxID=349315 RepID=A0ABP4X2D5_9ACTN
MSSTGYRGILVVTGTGTEVGKTITTAAIAALALADGASVAVVKPAQTGVAPGEPGDLADVVRLAGDVTCVEYARYPDPLAPATAARRAGLDPIDLDEVAAGVRSLAATHDLVLVEGAGGLLVWFDEVGTNLSHLAMELKAPVLVVAAAGLGTLNATALTCEALRVRGLTCLGVVVGSFPAEPDLASASNLADLSEVADAPLLGVLPERLGTATRADFLSAAKAGLDPVLGGTWPVC